MQIFSQKIAQNFPLRPMPALPYSTILSMQSIKTTENSRLTFRISQNIHFRSLKILAKVYLPNLHSLFEGWFALFTFQKGWFCSFKIKCTLQLKMNNSLFLDSRYWTIHSYDGLITLFRWMNSFVQNSKMVISPFKKV